MTYPLEAVRKVVTRKKFKLAEQEIKVVAAMLTMWRYADSLERMDTLIETEEMISDAKHKIKPAFWSTVVLYTVTFCLGATLILVSVCAGCIDR